jgi:hypothetical protein
MTIRKRTHRLFVMGTVTAAVIGLGAGTALAATAWKVTPGGNITAKAGKTTLKDPTTGTTLACKSSSGKGSVKKGTHSSGAGLGSITSLGFSSCTGPLGLTFKVSSSHFPWKLNAVSFKSGVTTGSITGIHATLSGPSCKATVDGTGASKNNGMVKATYTNSSGILKVLTTGGNLHIYNVSGCAGLVHSGNSATFSGSYKVTPKQKITRS